MTDNKILNQVYKGKLSIIDAYNQLFDTQRTFKKAQFVVLRMNIREHKVVSLLLNTLFLLPTPIGLAKSILKKIDKNNQMDEATKTQVMSLLSIKDISLEVKSKEADIYIKTI